MMEVVLDVQAQLAPPWGPWSSWGQDLRCQQAQSLPALGMVSCTLESNLPVVRRCSINHQMPSAAYFQPGGQPENVPEDPASASRGPERTLGLRARGCGCAGVCFPLAISLDRDSAWGSLSLCHPSVVVTVSWDREARGENSRSSIKSPHRATIPLR